MNFNRFFYFTSWAVLVAVAFSCKSTSQLPVYSPEQIVPQEKSLLWKISGHGLKKNSYLFGTIHLIPKSDFILSDEARVAFDAAGQVVFEIDLKDLFNLGAQFSLFSKSLMAGGKTLKDLLPAEDYSYIHQKLSEKGLPPSMLERLKPMFLSMLFANEEASGESVAQESMTSVEMELYQMARNRAIKTAGLETAAYQMSIFDSIPYEVQAKMLVQTLRSQSSGNDDYAEMMDLYRRQDIQSMQVMVGEEGSEFRNYEDLLLNKRNSNWIPVMARLMKEQPTFFAVGAGHLGGPEGVIALLRKAGYRVDAVKSGG